jgi:putative transcriptional regulator
MASYHPDIKLLSAYCEGSLSPASSLIVSAHLDMCAHCREKVEAMTEAQADIQLDIVTESASYDLSDMISGITSKPQIKETTQSSGSSSVLKLEGKEFVIPRTLTRYLEKVDNWKQLVGNLWQAPVDTGTEENMSFLFMSGGGKVPEHTHRGNELTLVINGSFADEKGNYSNGDFIFNDGDVQHTPQTDDPDGCLIFTVVDQPLHFTSGLARLINPFSHLFFK